MEPYRAATGHLTSPPYASGVSNARRRADGFIGEDPVSLRFADNRSVGATYKPTY